ncbi:MAG: DNA topoisomerase, partial [Planctomycetota bacterium]|nr:DNA topoisomerase [Planctomycetota bacterium]
GVSKMEARTHTTQPPARYTEASLTRALEERGIGRPSTYAAIIETILQRDYVFKRGTALVPTWTAFAVCKLLEVHLPKLVDYAFTAQMEDDLDTISRGEAQSVNYLHQFYFGNGQPGLKQQLANKVEEIDAREANRFLISGPSLDPSSGEEVYVRVGRYGPFVEQGERRASLPDAMPPDELTLAAAIELLLKAEAGEQPLGFCPVTNRPVFLKEGRYGAYVQIGAPDDEVKQNASLLKGMTPSDIDLNVALKLLSLPRELGPHPESGEAVVAYNGRFGPYVKCGAETRSLPAQVSPLEVTLEEALALLAQPKQLRGRGAPREPLRQLDVSPVTEQVIKVLDGRFGPYLTDGTTNASVPKGVEIAEISMVQALEWLADRAAMGPSTGRRGKKKATKAAAPKKKKTTRAVKSKQGPPLESPGTKTSKAKKATTKKSATKKTSTKKATSKKATATKAATSELN